MRKIIILLLCLCFPASAQQQTEKFSVFVTGLPSASVPLSGIEAIPVVQSGLTKQLPASAFGASGPQYNVLQWGLVVNNSGAAATNDAAFATALAAINSAGGGTLQLPCGDIYTSAPIDNKYPMISVVGGDTKAAFHDAGNNATYCTRILPTFAGTVLRHRTPYVATSVKFTGGGFSYITVDGNSIGTLALDVDTISYATYILNIKDMLGTQAVLVETGVSNSSIAEAADSQNSYYDLTIRQIDGATAQNSKGVVLTGSSNANTSFNTFNILAQYASQPVLEAVNADNNIFNVRAFRSGVATPNAVQMDGQTASQGGGHANYFLHLSASTAIYAQGTSDAGVTGGVTNTIAQLDTDNSTPQPTAGTGSQWAWSENHTNVNLGFANGQTAFGDNVANAAAARSNIGVETLRITNNVDGHVFFQNTADSVEWLASTDGANFRIIQTKGGTNTIEFGNVHAMVVSGTSFIANSVTGVSCTAGTVSLATLTVNSGIVTHC